MLPAIAPQTHCTRQLPRPLFLPLRSSVLSLIALSLPVAGEDSLKRSTACSRHHSGHSHSGHFDHVPWTVCRGRTWSRERDEYQTEAGCNVLPGAATARLSCLMSHRHPLLSLSLSLFSFYCFTSLVHLSRSFLTSPRPVLT